MLEVLSALVPAANPRLDQATMKAIQIVGRWQDLIVISPRSRQQVMQSAPDFQQTISPWLRRGTFRWIDVSDRVRWARLSPTGKRALFEARGEIFTVPAEKGPVRNLTATPGIRERGAVWSPDGKHVAYLSDRAVQAAGEYMLCETFPELPRD
mgnify:CR=1 FL=1